ncbi:MAG: hypothetical protein HY323_10115 [Betaproteobacteria bacterium]|nr:hypothetical protein [Betaproteobacteria bacterium]
MPVRTRYAQRRTVIVIDFRVRPPYRSFLNLSMYRGTMPGMTVRGANPLPRGATERSMPVFLEELKEAGAVHAVAWGRVVSDPKESSAPIEGIFPTPYSRAAPIRV